MSHHPEIGLEYWMIQPIGKLELRERSRNGLDQFGIKYVHELVELSKSDILAIPNLGLGSYRDVKEALGLVGLSMDFQSDLIVSSLFSNSDTKGSTGQPTLDHNFSSITLSRLGFSIRTRNCLESAEITTANELASVTRQELKSIPNMGKKSLSEIERVLYALNEACDSEGNFSEQRFTQNPDFAGIIPSEYRGESPTDFIDAISLFFQEFCSILDERERYIAEHRIWSPNGIILTLVDIGIKFDITRERVRQIEKRIVKNMAGILCEGTVVKDKTNSRNYMSDYDFSSTWMKAADSFVGVNETDIYSFTQQLCSTWNIDLETLLPVLPIAIVAFTRSTTTELTRELRNDSHILAPMSKSSSHTKSTRLSSFRIGRHAKALSKMGLKTIEDVHRSWPPKETTSSKYIVEVLTSAESFLEANGNIEWRKYKKSLGLEEASVPPPTKPSEFFALLNDFLSENIPNLMTWKNCREVFDIRTRYPAERRKTLADCAGEILGKPKNGPVIARIEKYLLENIANAMVNHDFSFTTIWIPKEYLAYFTECRELYGKSNDDYQLFCTYLCKHFSLSHSEVLNCSAVLWGVLNGLPPQRYFHLTGRQASAMPSVPQMGQKIKLVGFRRVH